MALTVGSLFSGIGGIDLGLERAGMVTRWFCEIDPHCRNVLARHWPGLPIYGDITAVDWGGVEPVDVLAGGFPCQPISGAGKQLAQADERWLWPEFARAIRGLRPRYVLVENVRNLLAVNGGSAFAEVLGDLAALGYDAEWDCIPASAVGAPHERDRLWLLAYPERTRPQGITGTVGAGAGRVSVVSTNSGHVADAESDGRPRSGARDTRRDDPAEGTKRVRPEPARDGASSRAPTLADTYFAGSQGRGRLEQCAREQSAWSDGRRIKGGKVAPPGVPRVAHGVPHRVGRLRATGNAVVPQVVEWIGHRIVAFDAAMRKAA